jgi:spore coat protein U-like protein
MQGTNQKKFHRIILSLPIALAATLLSQNAMAGTDTSNFAVSATVAASCTVDASGGLDFGAYDPIVTNANSGSDAEQAGTINTTCTNGATATLTLDQGANADDGSTDEAPLRRMKDGTDFLDYQLYTDSEHTTVWDNTTGQSVTGTGASSPTTVYGVITKGQNVPAGSYTDTVVATITF